jgi:hypothetical protein
MARDRTSASGLTALQRWHRAQQPDGARPGASLQRFCDRLRRLPRCRHRVRGICARCSAIAPTPKELLQLVGRYLLTLDAPAAADAEAAPRKGQTAEEKLSISFLQKAKRRRRQALDKELAAIRESISQPTGRRCHDGHKGQPLPIRD